MSDPPRLEDSKRSPFPEREPLRPRDDDEEVDVITGKGGKRTGKAPKETAAQNHTNDDAAQNEVISPDGGWGWLVTFGSFVNMAILGMLVSTYGLVYSDMFREFNVSSTKSSWIFNINQFLWNCSAMLGGPLIAQFGWRKVAMSGGVLISMATIMNAYIPNPNYLFFTFSFLTGLGQGLIAVVSFVAVPHYFDSKRGFAVGITSSGICAGQFSGPLIAMHFLEQYGYSGSMLILGGICLHAIVVSSLFHPVEWHTTKPKIKNLLPTIQIDSIDSESQEEKKYMNPYLQDGSPRDPNLSLKLFKERRRNSSISSVRRLSLAFELSSSAYLGNLGADLPKDSSDLDGKTTSKAYSGWKKFTHVIGLVAKNVLLFKWFRVQIIAITLSLALSTYVNFLMLVPFAMTDAGHSMEMVSATLAVAGICNMVARLLVTTLTDFVPFSSKYFFMGGVFGLFVTISSFTLVSSQAMIFTVMAFFGLSCGCCCCLLSLIVLEFMGFELLPQVMGLDGLTISISFIIFAPIVGGIRDLTQSYALTIQILSLAPLISFFLWFLMPCAILLDKKREALHQEKYLDCDD